MGFARELAQYCASLSWDELPSEVRQRACDRLVDALSTAAGSVAVAAPPLKAAVKAFALDDRANGVATLIGAREGRTPEAAAFVNGVGIHAILYESINLRSGNHPGPVVCAAGLAVAESTDASLSDLLLAILVGYEVQLFLGDLCGQEVIAKGFRTTSVFGAIAAAAVSARLLGLDEDRFTNALGLAANEASGLPQGWIEGTFEPYLEAGSAASIGMYSARLAMAGAVAAESTFEGKTGYFNAFAGQQPTTGQRARDRWRILEISCKPYPISGTKMTSVDSALEIVAKHGPPPEEIVAVDAFVPPNALHAGGPAKPPFDNYIIAQDSAPFLIAAALCGKPMLDLKTYFVDFGDPLIATVAEKVTLHGEPDRLLGRLRVTLANGEVLEEEVDRRSEQVPTVEKMLVKLRGLGGELWDDETLGHLGSMLSGPTDVKVKLITGLLRRVRAPAHMGRRNEEKAGSSRRRAYSPC